MKHLVVLSSGWVFVGVPNETKTVYTDASCVRKWGTSCGLGQLALQGPQKDTLLDSCGEFHPNPSAVLFVLPCPGWK